MHNAEKLLHDTAIETALEQQGWCRLPGLLSPGQCAELIALYRQQPLFRSKVVMGRHGYGSGEYQYFAYPLPKLVKHLRSAFYPQLAGIANRWGERLGMKSDYPPDHGEYLRQCAAAGQSRPTPLLLKYGPGDYNRLHQDLYGEWVFPLQMTVLLSCPQADFSGGEFILTEQRPRMQSRPHVVPLARGDAVIFPVRLRPGTGPRGDHRLTLRHGVSALHSGQRYALGIIFHDAA